VKKAGKSEKHYFNFTAQCEDKARRGVCFSAERRSEMHALAQTKRPVKIENVDLRNSYRDEITVKKFTKITPVEKCKFVFSQELSSSSDAIMSISSVSKLAKEQLVSIKAEVVQVSSVKKISTSFKGELRKQDVIVRDSTSSIKIVMWEDNVDCVEVEKTYEFTNLRVKGSEYDRYLNTPQNERFSAKLCTAIEQELVAVDSYLLESGKSVTVTGKIVAFKEAMKMHTCIVCHKMVTIKPGGVLAFCQLCKMTQSKAGCQLQWKLKVVVQDQNQKTRPVYLDMPQNILVEMTSTFSRPINLESCSEDELLSYVLSADKTWKFTYDSKNEITGFEVL
jgi:uncharacterized CHY-type Zn-finger protein